MNKTAMLDNFSINVEKERILLGLTQQEMASALGVSLSSYKMFINCQTMKIDVHTLVRLYELTGKFAYEFLGIDDDKTKIVSELNMLSADQLNAVRSIICLMKT